MNEAGEGSGSVAPEEDLLAVAADVGLALVGIGVDALDQRARAAGAAPASDASPSIPTSYARLPETF